MSLHHPFRPSRAEILAAANRVVADVIAEDLHVLFVGINPGLYTAAIGHHFGRPGNRFWPALYLSGFTPRLFSPFEEQELLYWKLGITNIVERATARADELADAELVLGAEKLCLKVRQYRPRGVALLGLTAYRQAFARSKAVLGKQAESLEGAELWVLPNPSGLNAHYNLEKLVRLFSECRETLINPCNPVC